MNARRTGALAASVLLLGALVVLGVSRALPSPTRSATTHARLWAAQDRPGTVPIKGEVPLVVAQRRATYVGHHPANAALTLNFGFPIRDRATLDALIRYHPGPVADVGNILASCEARMCFGRGGCRLFDQRMRIPRLRLSQEWVASTTQRRARQPGFGPSRRSPRRGRGCAA